MNFVAADLTGVPEQFKDFFVGGYAEDRLIRFKDGELLVPKDALSWFD